MDAIELIKSDHRTADDLFTRFQQSTDAAERGELAQMMVAELSRHAAIEEALLYPAIREFVPNGDELTLHADEEHLEVKMLLAEIERMSPDDPQFVQKVDEMIGDTRHHVSEEESEILPKLAESCTQDQLMELGRQLEEAKRTAPTSPGVEPGATKDDMVAQAKQMGLTGADNMRKAELSEALGRAEVERGAQS